MPYESFRQYLEILEQNGCLKWIDAEVDKDWEITSVARNYFRQTKESERCALGFRNVNGYDIPVVLGAIGGSRKIYGLAMEAEPNFGSIKETWTRALANPLEPVEMDNGPCKEVILKGDEVDLYNFPIPTWTPEKDPAPFLTAPCLITRHAETGIGNIGTYRMEIKAHAHGRRFRRGPDDHHVLGNQGTLRRGGNGHCRRPQGKTGRSGQV